MRDELLEAHDGGVATLTLNRPEARNALTPDMMDALGDTLPRLASDRSVRTVVLTGAGGAFCAGGDVKRFAARDPDDDIDVEQRVHDLRRRMEVSRHLHEMPKPTLAVIPGPAAGAGLAMALACDFRLAADTAKLTTAFGRIGLSGDFGGSYFLTHLVGAARARELYFSSDVITGARAHELGIVTRVAPADRLEAEAAAFATHLASLPTVAIGYMKKNLNAALGRSLAEVMDLEAMHMIRTFMTDDHRNAARAFVEKRAPVFEGR